MKVFIFLIFALSFGNFGVTPAHSQNIFFNLTAFLMPIDEADELVKAGYELYQQKKYDEAIAKFQKAIELKPNDFRPYALSGFSYMAQWKLKSASESFAKAIELKPDNKLLYLNKAQADIWRNERDEAVATCRRLLEIDPTSARAYMLIGDALQTDDKRRDEAEAAYRAAVKADPSFVSAFVSLGNSLLYNKKDEKSAEENFRRAMESDPKKMAGRFELGRLMVKQKRLKEARQLWEGATNKEEKTFPNFITVLERAEKLQQATDALAKNPDDPQTLLEMGNAVMEGDSWVVDGRQERAIVHFNKALKIKSDFTVAQYAICKAYIQMADTYKANNKNVDEELVKLKQMDAKLAKEIEDYRKNYSGGIKTSTTNLNQ
jgi:tetratricopeptide (TPR) repeat protein